MTREEAINVLRNATFSEGNEKLTTAYLVVIEALEQEPKRGKWIPIKWHEITDEEREREGYPENWGYLLDCIMPDDGQRILVTTKNGFVEMDECYCDGEYVLESGDDWKDDVLAWQPLPEPYKESEEV